MSLFGLCEDCGSAARLRHKPDVPLDEQSSPSVCGRCRELREELIISPSDINHRGRRLGPIEFAYETSDSDGDRDE